MKILKIHVFPNLLFKLLGHKMKMQNRSHKGDSSLAVVKLNSTRLPALARTTMPWTTSSLLATVSS